ncbi:MAG: lysine--tRNA ligase [Candidatus Poribacteria bacterium]
MEEISDLIRQRHEKLVEIRELNIDPYPYRYPVDNYAADIINKFASIQEIPHDVHHVRLAGRIMAKRSHGKVSFAHIQDSTDQIQIFIRYNDVGEEKYNFYKKLLDVGDIIGVEGFVFRTKTGELTIYVKDFTLLAKSLRPLPEKWHGLQDKETRYRQRYVDLITNPDVKQLFLTRTKIIQSIRDFLNRQGFIEVDTPILQPIYGGATARPFITHHNALDIDLYLRIANELYLKRLIVGRFDRVYEFSKDFRNEGMDKSHNPEFTMLELYQAYADYEDMMHLAEEIISNAAKEALGTTQITYQGNAIDLAPPWRRLTMVDSIKEYSGIDIEALNEAELRAIANQREIEIKGRISEGILIYALFETFVEPNLVQPTIITDYPLEVSPLAKKKRGNDMFVERFEPYAGGLELGNAFSELNDPIDQHQRFQEQLKQREAGDEEAHIMDEDYVRALEYGMPPAGGLGIGIDRLVMLLTDSSSIRDVILFPQMRPER